MSAYRRNHEPGGTYFFTVTIKDRHSNLLTQNIQKLKAAIEIVKQKTPFTIIALVVLPDHLHTIWQLPLGDSNYSKRWRQIKSEFSKRFAKTEYINESRRKKNERGLWQRRYWEHTIINNEDLQKHIEYIHYNPVKHGYAKCAADWPYSTFHIYVKKGIYSKEWGTVGPHDGLRAESSEDIRWSANPSYITNGSPRPTSRIGIVAHLTRRMG
jgi:putative transposase